MHTGGAGAQPGGVREDVCADLEGGAHRPEAVGVGKSEKSKTELFLWSLLVGPAREATSLGGNEHRLGVTPVLFPILTPWGRTRAP